MLELLAGFIQELRAGRAAGEPHREPRRHGGGHAHPARGPRGVQVRAGRHAGEEQRPLAGLRDGVRGVLLAARQRSTRLGGDDDELARARGRATQARRQIPRAPAPARAAAAGEAMSPEEMAEMLYQGAASAATTPSCGPLARQAVTPLRRHGAGPARRRHLLPVPHAAEPRPRRRARAADAAGPRRLARAAHPARGAPRAATSTSTASTS